VRRTARVPMRCCSGWGLACRPCHQERGGLLPHLFTLAKGPVTRPPGGLFSVPLSVALGPPFRGNLLRLAVNQHPALRSPDLPPGHLHVPATVRPAPGRILAPGCVRVVFDVGAHDRDEIGIRHEAHRGGPGGVEARGPGAHQPHDALVRLLADSGCNRLTGNRF